jgi:serine/threonine-protein kinase
MFHCIHCRSEIDSRYKACPHCGEAITDFLRRHLEAPLDGKYQILSRLGIGGMGEVYKALHVHLNALRVIKLMRANIASDPGAHERFLREARLATRIHHPNVAALFDFSTLEDDAHYMVWEHIEGINLHELIVEKGPLSPRYAAKLAIQALHGLEAIHRAGIVHRDISPENLMIARDEDGEEHVKIIDLGIAKTGSEEGPAQTKTGIFVGKWKYCSPEHLGMLPAGERIDGRADLYSFGIVLYEMLTGVPPFQADTPHRFVMLHASERPKALRVVNPSVTASAELEAVIFKALEKDRGARYASAREFARALEALVPTLDETAGAPPPLPTGSELTEEPTQVSGRNEATVVTTQTVASSSTPITTPPPRTSFAHLTMERTPLEPAPAARPVREPRTKASGTSRWKAGAIVAVVAAVTAGAVATLMPKFRPASSLSASSPNSTSPNVPAALSTSLTVERPRVSAASAIPIAQGHLGINAFPWGRVISIRNLDNNAIVELPANLVTPVPVDLPPGHYAVTLENPQFRSVTQNVEVRANEESLITAQFVDPALAELPRFEEPR